MDKISPELMRAARSLLNWSADDLANESGVSVSAIRNFERGAATMMALSQREIVRTFEAGGVKFMTRGGVEYVGVEKAPEE